MSADFIKIVSWNVNSINARMDSVARFIGLYRPHVVMLQELRCSESSFPYALFEDARYNVVLSGQKGRNGVAIASLFPVEDVFFDLMGGGAGGGIEDARYVECCVNMHGMFLRIASVYVPNGGSCGATSNMEYKLQFLEALRRRMERFSLDGDMSVVGGDFNVAPEIIDVFDHKKLQENVCFSVVEREKIREIICDTAALDGWRLLNHDREKEFSWWDYRGGSFLLNRGMRLDYFLFSPQAADHIVTTAIHKDVRGWERASDHAPVEVVLKP